jgi:hypothetical protein
VSQNQLDLKSTWLEAEPIYETLSNDYFPSVDYTIKLHIYGIFRRDLPCLPIFILFTYLFLHSALKTIRFDQSPTPTCVVPHNGAPAVSSAAVHPGNSLRIRFHILLVVWRCSRAALRSTSRTTSIDAAVGSIFKCGCPVFYRGAGGALRTASRAMRRRTRSFRAKPAIVALDSSLRRICLYSSTLALQSNCRPRSSLLLGTD